MATPTQHKRVEEQQGRQMYSQIALYAAGNALSLFLFIILYQMNKVLSDFRDPMVYALLCSIALRAPKQKLMRIVDGLVQSDRRIVLYPFALLYAPVRVTQWAWGMLDEFLCKVQVEARKVAREHSSKGISRRGTLKLYSDAIFRVIVSQKRGKKKKNRNKVKQKKAYSDTILFSLACVCVCWLFYEWIRDSWSKASQLALVSTLVFGFCISLLVSLVQMVSPWHSASAAQYASPRVDHKPDAAGASSPLSIGSTSPLTPGRAFDGRNTSHLFNGNEEATFWGSRFIRIRMPWKIVSWVISVVDVFDRSMKRILKSGSHTLVSALLISALIVGTAGAVSFFTIQIIGEARDSLIAAKNVLSDPWTNGAQINDGNNGTSGKQQSIWERFPWLEPYHNQIAEFVDGSLPEVLSWLEVKGNKMLEMHNLTDAALEARYLIESLHGHRSCSAGEVNSMMISLAKARVDLKEKEETEKQTKREEQKLQLQLSLLLSSFQVHPGNRGNMSEEQDSESMEKDIVKTEEMLSKVQDELTVVSSDLLHARRLHQIFQNRLDLCSDSKDEEAISAMAGSNRKRLIQNLKQGYYKMVVDWKIAEGFQDIWDSVASAVGNFRADSSGSDSYSGIHIDSIQSFATAAMGPLIQISKAVMMSIESTTSAAFAGSLSIVKLGMGLLQFGMQSVLFLSLLFGLLSANDDPLNGVIKVLPFPPGARHRAAAVLNRSLGGVFVTLVKLALVHGLFTWVTFRIFDAPLVYTSSAISTAFALLPFFPQYTVAIPPLLALATQGRAVAGCILLLMHISAANFFEDRILEEAGGNSYLMSLSLFGGMWAFYPNSVMGCLLGPIFLSLLYAFGALHVELMSDGLAPHRSPALVDEASLNTSSDTPNFTFTGLRSERSKKKKRQSIAQGSPSTPSSQVQQLVL